MWPYTDEETDWLTDPVRAIWPRLADVAIGQNG